jgi:transcriptional regulator of heat shock response
MSQLTSRNIDVLKIIIDEYINTGNVIGSKLLLKKYKLWVSPATIRNDMAKLEQLELVYQPYNSAGRMPTSKWLRAFVNYLMEEIPDHFLSEKNEFYSLTDSKKIWDFIHKITYDLSQNTWEISFCLIPDRSIYVYSWIASFLEKNYKHIGYELFQIIKIVEDKNSFWNFIQKLPLNPWVNVFIWEENIIPFLKNYTIIVKKVKIAGEFSYLWIIGSLKMDYNFNISAIKWII